MSEILNTHTLWMGITEKLAVSEEKKISKLGNTAIETPKIKHIFLKAWKKWTYHQWSVGKYQQVWHMCNQSPWGKVRKKE